MKGSYAHILRESSEEFITRLNKLYNKAYRSNYYAIAKSPEEYLEAVIFYGFTEPAEAINAISETLKNFKSEIRYLKSEYKLYKSVLVNFKKNPDPDDFESRYYNDRYLDLIKDSKRLIEKLNVTLQYIKGFKKVKKFKPVSNYEVYDDTIVVCYNELGEEIYRGEWDYSPAKEYEREHDGTYPSGLILSRYHKNKNKNVEIIWEYDSSDSVCNYKILGYYGYIA